MTQLCWSEIFIDASELDFGALLSEWPDVVAGPIGPIGASAFGDLYFQRPDGRVERLDVLEGCVHTVADNFAEFQRMINSPKWQEEHLLTSGIALLLERGMQRGAGQFYGFAPHPALAGQVDWSSVMLLDAPVWHSICSQTLGSPA